MGKKTLLTICVIVFTTLVSAQTTDLSLLGFKGKVIGANINYGNHGSCTFDNEGNLTDKLHLWNGTDEKTYDVVVDKRSKKGLSGESDYGKFNATVSNNHISKIVITGTQNNYPSTYTCTYTYDKQGNLVKVNEVFVFYKDEGIEYGGGVYGVDNYQRELNNISAEYQRKLMSGMTRTQAQNWYNNAVARLNRAIQGVGVNAYARTKKTKKTVKSEYTYSNYEFDDFGNWISRTYQKGTDIQKQSQTINYEPEFWSQFYWDRLEKEGDLQKIETFFLNRITTSRYKELSSNYWNDRILDEVAKKNNNDLDILCDLTKKTIASDAVKEQALEIVRNKTFNNDVMAERDYRRVLQMKDLQRRDIFVFNNIYRQKIDARSESLRTDSIAFLINKAKQEFESAKYQQAIATSKGILTIDPQNETADNMCQESSYRIILSKEADNNVNESDYASFIDEYNTSSHVIEIQNKRALYASSLFNRETSNGELRRVNELPTDESTHKIVEKRYKKWMFKNNHGNFFHVGLDGEFAIGGANTIASGGLLLRFGYTANILNVVTGLKYNYLTSTSQMFKNPEEAGKAYFEKQYLSIPLIARFNLKHGYNGCTYIGIGTDINICSLSTKLRDVKDIKKEKFGNNDITFSPRISFGGRLLGVELELFAAYDSSNPFNEKYIKTYMRNGQNIKNACDKDSYDKQIKSNKFIDKCRGGLAIMLWF